MRNTTSNGVGSHILDMRYSGFYNLAGVAGFNPLTLNPSLWLDSSKTSAMVLSGTDTVALLDKSEGLSQTNTYTSNFSAGTDSWNVVDGALSANEDSITDDFGTSKDDCLEITIGSGVSNKQINRASTITDGKTYKITGSVYFPTANTKANSLISRGTVDLGYQTTDGTKGIWTNFEFTTTMEGLGSIYYFYFYNDGNGIYTGTGDLVYLNNVKMDEIAGNHMIQGTSANRPVADSATAPTRTTFVAANSEFLENTLDVATFAAMSQGSVAYVCDGNVSEVQFSLSRTDSNSGWIRFGIRSGGQAVLQLNAGSTTMRSTISPSVNDIIEWKSTGSVYKVFINGIEDTVVIIAGLNNGDWFDASIVVLNEMSIGSTQALAPLYRDTEHKQTFVFGTALTDEESLSLAVYMMSQLVAFNPLQLSPSLWLDSLGSDASILDGSDVVANLDKSQGLVETNIYTSDFSVGLSGWLENSVSSTGGNNGISDGVTSKDNVMSMVMTGGSTVHYTHMSPMTIGKSYEITLSYYIPTSNIVADWLLPRWGGAEIFSDDVNVTGEWTTIVIRGVAATAEFRLYAANGGSSVFDSDGDVIHFSDIIINEIEGNHFVQTASANRPLSDDPDYMTQTEYTAANSEFLENTLDVATFAAMSTGMVFYAAQAGGVGEQGQFSIADSTGELNLIRIGQNASNKAQFQINASGSLTVLLSVDTLQEGTIVSWCSTGSAYKLYIDGISAAFTVDSGLDDGKWNSSVAGADIMSVGAMLRLTPSYYNTISKQAFVFDGLLTDYEVLVQSNYMIEQAQQGAAVRAGSEVIAKLTGTLADGEEAKIRATVEEMYLSGNWDKMDYFFGWFLEDEANALISWKGTKTATNVNAAQHDTSGFTTNGSTSYIDTGIVPSTDGTSAVLDDIHIDAYVYNNSDTTNAALLGANDGTSRNLFFQLPASRMDYYNNSISSSQYTGQKAFQDKTRYSLGRTDSANQQLIIDGVEVDTEADASVALTTFAIVVGGDNASGTVGSHIKATQSYLVYGGGFDLTALNTELTNAEARFSLDNEAQQVINKFPNPLTATEDAKIRSFVNGMVADGNWDKLDYFYGWFLSDETNALTSWKGIKTATNVNSAVHGVTGFTSNGVSSYIDTNIIPSTDGTNAVLDDTYVSSYVYENLSASNNQYIYGATSGSGQVAIRQESITPRIRMWVNSTSLLAYNDQSVFANRSRYATIRDSASNISLIINGTVVATGAAPSVSLPADSIYVGGINLSGGLGGQINTTQGYFVYGGGFNLTALNTRLNALQTSFNLN